MLVSQGEMAVALCAAGQWLMMVAAGAFLDPRPPVMSAEVSPRARHGRAWNKEIAGLVAVSAALIALAALDGSEWAREGMLRNWACLVPASVWAPFVLSGILYRSLSQPVAWRGDSPKQLVAGPSLLLVVFGPALVFLAARAVLGLDSQLNTLGGFWVVGASLGVIWVGRNHLRQWRSGPPSLDSSNPNGR
jgi:hypothetical protein